MKLNWEKIRLLSVNETKLYTVLGRPFTIVTVKDRMISVKVTGGREHTIQRKNLEKAVQLLNKNETIEGPGAYKEKVGDERPSYAWAILKKLGHIDVRNEQSEPDVTFTNPQKQFKLQSKSKKIRIDAFSNPKFRNGIINIAKAYGNFGFWIENLSPQMNPDATWRALLLLGCLKRPGFQDQIRSLLVHKDSRVRAWACFALGQMEDEKSVDQIQAMNADPSNRVRIHAWQAIQSIVGHEHSARHFPIRIPQYESLVLVSEDSKEMGAHLTTLFQRMGYRVAFGSSERETKVKALTLKPAAIITDNQKYLDNLSGLNLTWDICRILELRETVIFMLTADFIEPIFLWNGGDYFLSKSRLGLEELIMVANEYLHH